MSEDNKLTPEQAFAKWLDHTDTPHIKQPQQGGAEHSDDNRNDDAIWQQRLKTANSLEHQVSLQVEEQVPDWDRGAAFDSEAQANNTRPWWQWGGLPAMSMAFSAFALVLVLFNVKFIINDDGVLLTFGQQQQASYSQTEIDALVNAKVDQKLQMFASEQQVILANYVADIKVKQQDNNLQLASYIIGASRQERQEDISDFIQYINDQRADDSLNNKIKFQQLESDIHYQSIKNKNINYQPINSNNLKVDDLSSIIKPANWTSQE